MDSIYEKLFSTYGESVLQEAENYSEVEVLAQLDGLSLDGKTRLRLEELFYGYYTRWSTDAFALGLHLGLSLLDGEIRRLRPQQV